MICSSSSTPSPFGEGVFLFVSFVRSLTKAGNAAKSMSEYFYALHNPIL